MTPNTARCFAATHLTRKADQFLASITPPPHGVPPGLRITLLADYHRALTAAEDARDLAWAESSWESAYAHLSEESDPQTAATEAALDQASAYLADYHTALHHAGRAFTPAA